MAWFGESLSSLTGHLQNLTKEVLSESGDGSKNATEDLRTTKAKLEELEAVCSAQDLEITALKKQNGDLRRRLEEAGLWDDHALGVQPATTWLSIEQRCDAGYNGGGGRPRSGGSGHSRSLSDAAVVKHHERLEKELKEKIQLIEHLQMQLQNVEKEHHMLSLQMKEREKEVAELKERSANEDEILKNKSISEDKLLQINSELQNQLIESNSRAKELEEELLAMRNQCLDTVIDSQVCTSEIRSDVEQARKRIANENGAQKAERLRAHQDMVNRMIQIGEKSKENDISVKKLHSEDKKLVAEIISQIQKLGDQEQQELIHGTLKALELENQVLNMRNAQLEHEVQNDSGMESSARHKNFAANAEQGRSVDVDDTDTLSFQSEQSDFTILSQKFESQIAVLQSQLQVCQRDLKAQENHQIELLQEKEMLMNQVKSLSDQLREKLESISVPSPKETSVQTDEHNEMERRLLGVEENIGKSKLYTHMQQMQVEKQCLSQELEAMARVVQDLETKVAVGEEERRSLITSMEELDQQHQDALEKLLHLRKADQVENDELKSQVEELKLTLTHKSQSDESAVQTENFQTSDNDALTQTESVSFDDKGNQTSVMVVDEATSTNNIDGKINELQVDPLIKFDLELCERIKKSITFDIPNDFNKTQPHSFYLIREIIKIANDSKWVKDALERKMSELIRENKNAKSAIEILEAECFNLKDNIERLAEQLVGVAKSGKDPLPTILENCEEMEVLEQKNATLEAEVEVLRETRVNLELDAVRMRDDRQELLARIRNLEAHIRNQDNLQREVERLNHASMESREAALAAAESNRICIEVKAQSLAQELEILTEKYETDIHILEEARKQAELKDEESVQKVLHKEQEVQEMKNIFKGLEVEKASLLQELQEKSQRLEETCFKLRENSQERQILDLKIAELQKHFEEEKELREKLSKASGDLELSAKMKLDLENQLHALTQKLQNAELQAKTKEELELELRKWKKEASSEEQKVKSTLETMNKLKQENEALKEQIRESNDEITTNKNKLNENFVKEIEELNEKVKLMSINEESFSIMTEGLKLKINLISNEKLQLEQNVDRLTKQVTSLNEEVEKYRLEIHEKEQSILQYQQMVSLVKGDLNTLGSKLQEKYQNELLAIEKRSNEELQRLKSEINALEDDKHIKLTEIKVLSSDLANIKSISKGLREERTKLLMYIKDNEENWLALPQLHERINLLEKEKLVLQNELQIQENSFHEKDDKAIQSEKHHGDNEGDPEFRRLYEEKQELILSLNERTQEVGLLQVQLQQLKLAVERDKQTTRQIEEEKEAIFNDKSHIEEKLQMTKETVSKLSEMIKEKDAEIETMRSQIESLSSAAQESENIRTQLLQAQLSETQVVKVRDQLLQTVQVKHQESIQYHNEIQRLSLILSQEMAKFQQLSAQYAALVKTSEEQQVGENPAHQLELQSLQELIKVKEEGMQQLSNRLELQDQELRARGMELEMLRHQIESMALERAHSRDGPSSAEFDDLQEKYSKLVSTVKDEQQKSRQLHNEFELCQGREFSLQRELERLRIHLVEIEDTYTQEALKTEEQIRDLLSKLQQAEEMITSSSTVYKSANIRANQQVETLQEQARLIAQQRDDVQGKLSAAEDQVAKHAAALRNLQTVLEQFQRDKEREIESAKASVYLKVEAAHQKHNELLGDISSLKSQLREAKEGLSAASRLGQELERKTEMVIALKQEVAQLVEKLKKSDEAAQTVNENAETKVDKSLVKNVVLGYFLAPSNAKEQVLQVVSSVLDFSVDEKSRIQKQLGLSSEGGGGLLKGLLHPGGSSSSSQQSLSEAFVRFLENESIPQAKLKMLPDSSSPVSASSSRPTTPRANTPVNTQNRTPLLLTDVQLPTFAQLPVGRNSSSLLKDILRES